MVKLNYLPALPEMLLWKSLCFPANKHEELKHKFQNRLRSWRSHHITAMRKVIGQACDIPELHEPNSRNFRCDDALIAACQLKLPWDTKKEPHDITWLASGDDPLGSEIFISIIEGYQKNILKKLGSLMPVFDVPNMQEFTWMLRMVRVFVLICFLEKFWLVFFFPTDLQVVGWAGAWQPIREGRQLPQELPRVARVHHVVGAAFRDLQGQEMGQPRGMGRIRHPGDHRLPDRPANHVATGDRGSRGVSDRNAVKNIHFKLSRPVFRAPASFFGGKPALITTTEWKTGNLMLFSIT